MADRERVEDALRPPARLALESLCEQLAVDRATWTEEPAFAAFLLSAFLTVQAEFVDSGMSRTHAGWAAAAALDLKTDGDSVLRRLTRIRKRSGQIVRGSGGMVGARTKDPIPSKAAT